MQELTTLLQFLNVLIIPVLGYVVRMDRKLGQIDVIQQSHERRITDMENRVRSLELRKEPA
jgi:hypothetical protein